MKLSNKIVLEISTLLLCFNLNTFGQQYFPLNIGNKFVYHYVYTVQTGGGGFTEIGDYVCAITKDTLVNNKRYFYIKDFPIENYLWFRVDSITGSLYTFDNSNPCIYYNKENLIDSLRMKLGDTSNSCNKRIITDIDTVIKWGKTSLVKYSYKSSYPSYSTRKYSTNFGLVNYDSYGGGGMTYYSFINNLKGCKINGIVYGDTTVVGINENEIEINNKFTLNQNYPNPFNPNTHIKFYLPRNSFVSLKVFDIFGKEIETLIKNKFMTFGTKVIDFKPNNISSGIYFYRLTAGDFKEVKRMVYIK